MRQESFFDSDLPLAGLGRASGIMVLPRLRANAPDRVADPPPQASRGSAADSLGAQHASFATSEPGPWSDSRPPSLPVADKALDAERQRLIEALNQARLHPQPGLRIRASFGPASSILFDFERGKVAADIEAWRRLRLQHELPYPASAGEPDRNGTKRELDLALWEIGYAAGEYALRDATPDWWHTPMVANQIGAVARYTKLPLHLELARVLASEPLTPAQLRRRCRATIHELRCFIQASLFLGLLQWTPPQTGANAP